MAEVVLCDRAADNRDSEHQDNDDPACDRDLVALQADPDLFPVALGPDLDVGSELAVGLGRCYAGQARLRADELFTVWCAAHVGG
jgi:hypothetical protein